MALAHRTAEAISAAAPAPARSNPCGHHHDLGGPKKMATTAEIQTREKLFIGGEWVIRRAPRRSR